MIARRARVSRVPLLASLPLLALVALAAGCGTVTTAPAAAPSASASGTAAHSSASGAPAEVGSGCTSQYKDPFLMYSTPRPSPGGAVFSTRPGALRICVYSSDGTLVSRFLRGTTVKGSTVTALLDSLSGARRTSICTLPNSTFAVVGGTSPGAPVLYVELGGCYRVLRFGSGTNGTMGVSTGQASPQAVSIIESVTHPKP